MWDCNRPLSMEVQLLHRSHTLPVSQGPKPEEGNETAVKWSKARNLASGKHAEEPFVGNLSTAWHTPL